MKGGITNVQIRSQNGNAETVCARRSPSGSAAMPRPSAPVFSYMSRFSLRACACLGARGAKRRGWRCGVSRTAGSAADLYQRQAHATLSLPQLPRRGAEVIFECFVKIARVVVAEHSGNFFNGKVRRFQQNFRALHTLLK